MENKENGEKTDIVKLFIILMTLSAIGFGVGAAYLYHAQSACAALVEREKNALGDMKRLVESPVNKAYWGLESGGAGRTAGAELSTFLEQRARAHGLESGGATVDRRPYESKGYVQTAVKLKLEASRLENLVRYLHKVQETKKDIFLKSLTLSYFDYTPTTPTCKATIEALVFELLERE
jgi:hypothetical protein